MLVRNKRTGRGETVVGDGGHVTAGGGIHPLPSLLSQNEFTPIDSTDEGGL